MTTYRTLALRVSLAFVKAFFALAVIIFILLGIALTTEVFTKLIASRLISELNSRTDLTISYEEVAGAPIRNLTIKGLEIQFGPQKLNIGGVQMTWDPFQLMSGMLDISTMQMQNVSLVLGNTSANEEISGEPLLETIAPLGIDVNLPEFIVNGFTLHTGSESITLDTFQTALQINDEAINLTGVFARLDNNELTGSVTVTIGNQPNLNADLAWYSPFVASVIPTSVLDLIPELASDVPSGQLLVSGWENQLSISHILNTPLAINSTGTLTAPLNLDSLEFSFVHTSNSIEMVPSSGVVTAINNLQASTEGDITRQLFELSGAISDDRLSDLEFISSAALAGTILQFDTIELKTTTGIVSADLIIDFTDALQMSGSYTIDDSNPLSLFTATTPFELSNLTSSGNFNVTGNEQTWNGGLQINEFLGELSGYPLSGNASLRLMDNVPIIEQLKLATSDNSLEISGNPSDAAGVSWALQAPALNQLLTNAAGSINGNGTFSNADGNIIIAGALIASNVEFETYYADAINVAFDLNQDTVSAKVELQNIGNFDTERLELISTANLDLSGNPSRHVVSGIVNSPYMTLTSNLQGSLLQTGQNWEWTGSLTTANVNSSYGLWSLQSPLQVSINDALGVSTDGGCFSQDQTQLCAQLDGSLQDSLEAAVSLERFQLSQFNQGNAPGSNNPFITPPLPQLPPGFLIDGVVTANLNATLGASSPDIELSVASIGTQLTIDPSLFPEAEETPEVAYEIQSYQIDQFSISAIGNLARLELSSLIEINEINLNDEPLSAPGQVSSQIVISDLQNLEGDIRLNLPSLAWVEAIAPGASNIQGSLTSDITIGGNFNQPELGGNINFSDLALDVEALGIRLFDVNLQAEQIQANAYSIVGSLNSSEGSANITGEVTDLFLASWTVDATLAGNNFLFINRPELVMAASPDLRLTASSQVIDIQGNLGVPKLQLDIAELPDTAVDVSRDVVISNYSSAASGQEVNVYVDERSIFSIPITAEVTVALEDEIGFTGFGISAQLAGDITYRQAANGASSTYGELNILSGSYRAYRQELTIKQGQLLFFGAIDNPALDIRAVREVDEVIVGVLMNGTLKSINSQLFSTPALPENDIISLIATGRKFSSIGEGDGVNVLNTIANLGLNRSQGITNSMRDKLGLDALQITNTGDINTSILTVGKYVTPDIFIRYGVGLFDNQSRISVDYTLSEHLKLQAESGEFQSIDITYQVEK